LYYNVICEVIQRLQDDVLARSADQKKAVLKTTEDIAFWKVVSAGAAGDMAEAEHSFACC